LITAEDERKDLIEGFREEIERGCQLRRGCVEAVLKMGAGEGTVDLERGER